MLLYCIQLQLVLDQFVQTFEDAHNTSYCFKLSVIEWQQIHYLIQIFGIFHCYTLALSCETESTLPAAFHIYNSVFNHLKTLYKQLEKKLES